MPLTPFPSEIIPDEHFSDLIIAICKRPQMWLGQPSFDAVCAMLQGYDLALWKAPLLGLRDWLVVRVDGWNNLNWSGLALRCLIGKAAASEAPSSGAELLEPLGQLLVEFLEYRRANGLTMIFADYAEWLTRQDWYEGPLRKKRNKRRE
jgi:hypothetical protein